MDDRMSSVSTYIYSSARGERTSERLTYYPEKMHFILLV